VEFTRTNAGQPALLLGVGAVAQDRLRDDAGAERRPCRARVGGLVPEDELVHGPEPEPSPALGPGQREPAARAERPVEVLDRGPLLVLVEEAVELAVVLEKGAHLRLEGLLFRGEADPHESFSILALGSGFQRGSRFSTKARGPSMKSGCDQCRRSSAHAYSSASP